MYFQVEAMSIPTLEKIFGAQRLLNILIIYESGPSFTVIKLSAGRHLISGVSCSHVCSSGGGQRRPRGRIQHGKHPGHHALQVRFISRRTVFIHLRQNHDIM